MIFVWAVSEGSRVGVCSFRGGDPDFVLWDSSNRSSWLGDLIMMLIIF
jgi:hypothetical protein